MCVFFQAEDGIRDLVRSRGLGDVYKRQCHSKSGGKDRRTPIQTGYLNRQKETKFEFEEFNTCLLYTSDAADERTSVDLGGRRIIKKKNKHKYGK